MNETSSNLSVANLGSLDIGTKCPQSRTSAGIFGDYFNNKIWWLFHEQINNSWLTWPTDIDEFCLWQTAQRVPQKALCSPLPSHRLWQGPEASSFWQLSTCYQCYRCAWSQDNSFWQKSGRENSRKSLGRHPIFSKKARLSLWCKRETAFGCHHLLGRHTNWPSLLVWFLFCKWDSLSATRL